MTDQTRSEEPSTIDSNSTTMDRRTVLKGTGTTIVGAAGLTAATGPATAQTPAVETIELSSGWLGWSADGELPVVDELFVFVNGWFTDRTTAEQAADVVDSLQSAGYEPDAAVALQWPVPAFGDLPDGEEPGKAVADLLEDFYNAGGGNVRIVGHGPGARCLLWAVTSLRWGYEIETVGLLGAAADGSEICDGPWTDGLDNVCEIRNYHSEDDETIGNAFGGPDDTAVGAEGIDCDPADSYTDVDVTDGVDDYVDYLTAAAIADDLVAVIENDACDDGDIWDWF